MITLVDPMLDVFLFLFSVMITMLVLMILVMNIPVVYILPKKTLIPINVLFSIVIKKKAFIIPLSIVMIKTNVQMIHAISTLGVLIP